MAIVIVRQVYAGNLLAEFALIRQFLCQHPFVAMDTEFPGVVFSRHTKNWFALPPADRYSTLKTNVDNLHLIQVGLTLSDAAGNLPTSPDGGFRYVWEFNFREFNPNRDLHAPESIKILRENGIDFERNMEMGVSSYQFAMLLGSSGLVRNQSGVTWVTFQGAYDFAYLVKILTGRRLPEKFEEFKILVEHIFGRRVFDIKHLMRYRDGLYGGLEQVARMLGVERALIGCHQAGCDSLLTCQVFWRMKELYFGNEDEQKHAGLFFGLD